MPHTSAANTRALRARRACTGEPDQIASSNMKGSGDDGQQVIPAAATAAQQELDAHVLLALHEMGKFFTAIGPSTHFAISPRSLNR